MEQNLEKIFLEKDLEQAHTPIHLDSGPGLTKVNNFWTHSGISRKFLREDMARKCIYPTTGPTRVPSRLANHVFER